MSDASRILVIAGASSVPRPPLEPGFSSHSSVVASEKDGGGDVLVVEEALRQVVTVSENEPRMSNFPTISKRQRRQIHPDSEAVMDTEEDLKSLVS